MIIPKYYQKYLEKKDIYEDNILEYFDVLNEIDWGILLEDLATNQAYPYRIASTRNEEDVTLTFFDFFESLSPRTSALMEKALNDLCYYCYQQATDNAIVIIEFGIRITKVLGYGLYPEFLIEVIRSETFNYQDIKDAAVLTLAIIKPTLLDIFNYDEKYYINNPAFAYAKIIGILDQDIYKSLEMAKYITKPFKYIEQFRVTFSGILRETFNDENKSNIFLSYWNQYSKWLQNFIIEQIFIEDVFENFKNKVGYNEQLKNSLGEKVIIELYNIKMRKYYYAVIALLTSIFDHDTIRYADALGLFEEFRIKLIYKVIHEYTDIQFMFSKIEGIPLLTSLPREIFQVPHVNHSREVAILNTFNLYTLITNANNSLEEYSEQKPLGSFEKIIRKIMHSKVYHIDRGGKKFVDYLIELANSLFPGLTDGPDYKIKPTEEEIVKLLDGKTDEDFFVVGTAPIIAMVRESKSRLAKIIVTSKNVEDLIKSNVTEDWDQEKYWRNLKRHYVHNSWILKTPAPFEQKLTESLKSIAFNTIRNINNNRPKFIDFLTDLWNVQVKNGERTKPLSRESIAYAVNNAYHFVEYEKMDEIYFKEKSELNLNESMKLAHFEETIPLYAPQSFYESNELQKKCIEREYEFKELKKEILQGESFFIEISRGYTEYNKKYKNYEFREALSIIEDILEKFVRIQK